MYYGTKTLDPLQTNIWELVPADLENVEFLEVFNSIIKIWEPQECPCRHKFMKRASYKISILFFCFILVCCIFLLLLFKGIVDLDYSVVMANFVVNYIAMYMFPLPLYHKCFMQL